LRFHLPPKSTIILTDNLIISPKIKNANNYKNKVMEEETAGGKFSEKIFRRIVCYPTFLVILSACPPISGKQGCKTIYNILTFSRM